MMNVGLFSNEPQYRQCIQIWFNYKKSKLDLSQSAAYPHTAPCNRTGVSFYRQKNIMEVPKLQEKLIH